MPETVAARRYFTTNLLKWHYEENNRDLPWKNEKDPYKIWLSEIILQQTRAEQGRPYYEKFISRYPDVHLLANAPEDEVFLLWQGLGYYNRCRNLLTAARSISQDYQGNFPDRYEDILSLKGVGAYTAAAIASFAYNLPHAVVDGNVYRVLSRYFGIEIPIDSNAGKLYFQQLASELLEKEHPAAYNQAIMDFGSSVCKPKSPDCSSCNLSAKCQAYRHNLVALLPVKEKKLVVKERYFHYLILEAEGKVYIQQRMQKDIWQNLYEFFLIESETDLSDTTLWKAIQPYVTDQSESVFKNRQRLTHQLIISDFYLIKLKVIPPFLRTGIWTEKYFLKNYAFPKTILSFSNRKKYF